MEEPKTRKRGARKQHAAVQGELEARFLSKELESVERHEPLIPLSPSQVQKRWNLMIAHLGLPRAGPHKQTLACLRGGGATDIFNDTEDPSLVAWRLRIDNVKVLKHYIQEVNAKRVLSIIPFE